MANTNRKQVRLSKGCAFRLGAVLLAVLPFFVAEIVFRWAGWGRVDEVLDPYVGFSEIHPLFERNAKTGRFEISASRLSLFCPDSFAIHKSKNEFRIFCLGGSTVQGRPYAIETSFTTWLELSLRAADPGREWDVVNCGGVSYASYRLTNILREVLNYEPDLVILYTGHNEFLEDRTYQDVKRTSGAIAAAHGWFSYSHVYRVCRVAWLQLRGTRSRERPRPSEQLAGDVDAVLDYRDGLKWYHRDDTWRQGVVAHFEFSLQRMVSMAEAAGVPLLLVNPVSNLKDCPPFKAVNSDSLSADERVAFETTWDEARALDSGRLAERLACVESAIVMDPRHAGAHFLFGHCLSEQRRFAEAKTAFVRAKDEDVCPLRMIEPLHEVLLRTASQRGVPLVDVRQLFEQQTVGGIAGEELMIDHVHPRISGHQLIAEALVAAIQEMGIVEPDPAWQERRARLYEQHLASLEAFYYARGTERLKGLEKWTKGEAPKVRGPE